MTRRAWFGHLRYIVSGILSNPGHSALRISEVVVNYPFALTDIKIDRVEICSTDLFLNHFKFRKKVGKLGDFKNGVNISNASGNKQPFY
jgi:hypothetical protein